MSKFTVLFQGDSITDCGRATCGGAGFDNRGLGPGYPGMIAARLACDRPDVDWQFINRGISGNRIVDLYARWKADCKRHCRNGAMCPVTRFRSKPLMAQSLPTGTTVS